MEWRPAEPAPVAMASGSTPTPKASEVMMMGRRRRRTASSVASNSALPWACSCVANSTIRMAFFEARPTVVKRPTWKYTSLSSPRRLVKMTAPSTPSGTPRITASGTVQLSYRAARHRNTNSTEMAYSSGACAPACFSWYEAPDHSWPMPVGRVFISSSMMAMASPVLTPGAASPSISSAGLAL